MKSNNHVATNQAPLEQLLFCLRNKEVDCVLLSSDQNVSLSFIDGINRAIQYQASEFQLSEAAIQELSSSLNEKTNKNGIWLSYLESRVLDVLVNEKSELIIFNKNGELITGLQGVGYFVVHLAELIKEAFPGIHSLAKELNLIAVEQKELKALDFIQDKNYHSVKVIKRKGQLDRVECEEKMPIDKRVIDIMRDAAFQSISINQEDGKAVHINRVVKQKL
ncbi:hypothetical protein [Pseudotamlana carrageenivorans]|uniref:Uncharacterized protein n=1 Tax=Pseudotamlana carrageenivorans TaxID=2069432 RepID=A0A2I7SGE2_9FLAO|nr:hypothetical protein [Tamlana carrageenivorans]AUS04979.1 hypothetical protein C1A40_05610 [Tamlana carrageenivorans]